MKLTLTMIAALLLAQTSFGWGPDPAPEPLPGPWVEPAKNPDPEPTGAAMNYWYLQSAFEGRYETKPPLSAQVVRIRDVNPLPSGAGPFQIESAHFDASQKTQFQMVLKEAAPGTSVVTITMEAPKMLDINPLFETGEVVIRSADKVCYAINKEAPVCPEASKGTQKGQMIYVGSGAYLSNK